MIKRFILFHDKRHPQDMGKPEIEAFLSHLVINRNVASSTQNQAFNAILFLYDHVLDADMPENINALRSKKPVRLPTVMTREESLEFIGAMYGTHQLMAKLMYGSGLRVMECIRLRVKDIDFAMNQLFTISIHLSNQDDLKFTRAMHALKHRSLNIGSHAGPGNKGEMTGCVFPFAV